MHPSKQAWAPLQSIIPAIEGSNIISLPVSLCRSRCRESSRSTSDTNDIYTKELWLQYCYTAFSDRPIFLGYINLVRAISTPGRPGRDWPVCSTFKRVNAARIQ